MGGSASSTRGGRDRTFSIHLALGLGTALGDGVLDGFAAYAGHRADWVCGHVPPNVEGSGPPDTDALLGQVKESAAAARWDAAQRGRVVNISRSGDFAGIASVTCDDRAIGRRAAEYLMGLAGLTAFAYVGTASKRERGFAETVWRGGRAYHGGFFDVLKGDLSGWLAQLPARTGVLAFNDGIASLVIRTALAIGRGVPEDLAVVGVDADKLQSLLSPLPITSVDPDFWEVGYRAAEHLDRALRGEDISAVRLRIPPKGVIERASSDFPGIDDPDVVAAARYIRQYACQAINVAEVVRHVPLSRRPLERRFKAIFGRTLLQEIDRVRVTEAARLLTQSNLPIAAIASESGFNSHERLTRVFGRETGMSPAAYRRQHSRRGNRRRR